MGKFEFNNESVIITDPCYLIKREDGVGIFAKVDEWAKSDYGSHMENLGFTKFVTMHNGIGDGGWVVKDKKTGHKLGEIWADSGQTGIYLLSDVEKYNPDSFLFMNLPDSLNRGALVLRDFNGEISWDFRTVKYTWDGQDMESKYLVINGSGKCGGKEVEFSVDFGGDDE